MAAWLLLVLGLGTALYLYLSAPEASATATSYSLVGGQRFAEHGDATGWQAQQIERMGGQGTLLLARLNDWLRSLWHGRRLAATLATATLVLALACLWMAALVEADDGPA